jgi:predicted lipoprotein with Yx(FWY)xxD motif
MNRMTTMLVAACAVAAVLLAAGCGGSSGASGLYGSGASSAKGGANAGMYGSASTTPSTATAASAATLGVGKTGIGQVLVNSAGHTLYLFEKDQNGRSACSGSCAGFWPPLISKGQPMALKGLNQSLVGTTTRSDGTEQVTYAGHPVYLFAEDTQPGQTRGEGLTDFGGSWDALSPAGAKIEGDQSAAAQTSSSQSGGW